MCVPPCDVLKATRVMHKKADTERHARDSAHLWDRAEPCWWSECSSVKEMWGSAQTFQINPWRAWGAVATTVGAVALSIYLIHISPPALLPLAWAFAGTAWTGVRIPCPSHIDNFSFFGGPTSLLVDLMVTVGVGSPFFSVL